MQIDHRCAEAAGPQQFFNGMYIGTGIQQMGGKRMAQGMGGIILAAQPDHSDIPLHKMLDTAGMHRLSFFLPFKKINLWPVLQVTFSEVFQQMPGQQGKAVFAALAGYFQLKGFAVYITQAQVYQLIHAQARAIKQ